jgi:uncharacterized membrane protein YkoI
MWLLAALISAVTTLPASSPAQDQNSDCKRPQDCALGAFKDGEIRALSEILAVAREKIPGEVVKIELEREKGVWVYEIKILTPHGQRREIEINAQTLEIVKIE